MKNLFIVIFLFLTIPDLTLAQQYNKTSIDSKTQNTILIGLCNRDGLKTGDFGAHYFSEYGNYKTDTSVINQLKKLRQNVTITIVSGTWCGDSKEQVPRFFKILDEAGFDENDLTLICIDRDKKAGEMNIDSLKINLVPTFIVYYDNKEVGRIIETPKQYLEKDLYRIIPKVN